MSIALDIWRARAMKVTVLERCDECQQLKQGVGQEEFWTKTGKVTHHCCSACARELSRRYYSPEAFL